MESRIQQYLVSNKMQQILYLLMVIICCFPFISASGSLVLGILFSILIGTPFKDKISSWGGYLLKASVIGLGFGINIQVLLKSGKENAGVTTLFVLGVLGAGLLIGLLLKMDKMTALLIAVGTAICGGSAIAVVGSAMKANSNQMSISTGTIFLLNALALITFPTIGHWMGLSQEQFGVWAGIAIHDTSSVVGAAAKFGDEALKVASITKMLRILWIIPVLMILVLAFSENKRIFKVPVFIVGFIIASCLFSFVPAYGNVFVNLYAISKQMLVVSLFVISSGVSIVMLKQVGKTVLLQAVLLWVIVSVVAMIFVKYLV